jgi:hypothetical protein
MAKVIIRRVMKSWRHWQIGNKCHAGFHADGACWKFFEKPKRTLYRSGELAHYSWWRFFIVFG